MPKWRNISPNLVALLATKLPRTVNDGLYGGSRVGVHVHVGVLLRGAPFLQVDDTLSASEMDPYEHYLASDFI